MVGILGGAFLGAFAFDRLIEFRGGWEAGADHLYVYFNPRFILLDYFLANS